LASLFPPLDEVDEEPQADVRASVAAVRAIVILRSTTSAFLSVSTGQAET
jgi:hypothetical protein